MAMEEEGSETGLVERPEIPRYCPSEPLYDPLASGYAPPAPGFFDYGPCHYFNGDREQQARDRSLLRTRLLARIGLHCDNLEKGTNLQLSVLREERFTGMDSQTVTFEAEDPLLCCTHRFQTHSCYLPPYPNTFAVLTTGCTKEEEDPPAPEEEEEGDSYAFSKLALDDGDSFKGDMPDWFPEDALITASDELQYYEMKESEVEENKEWLYLYAEFAVLSKMLLAGDLFDFPLELGKIIVRTRQEDVESKKKMVKAANAIFYMSFKSRDGKDCNAIIGEQGFEGQGMSVFPLKPSALLSETPHRLSQVSLSKPIYRVTTSCLLYVLLTLCTPLLY